MDTATPNAMHEAMRADLKKILEGDFSGPMLKNLITKAKAASQYLMADSLLSMGGDILNDETSYPAPGNGGPVIVDGGFGTNETMGAKLIREGLAAVAEIEKSKRETPERLVDAIAAAKETGQPEIAEALTRRLLGQQEADRVAEATAALPPVVSVSGQVLEHARNMQPAGASQIKDPTIQTYAQSTTQGASLRELAATDPD
jgi:hypothetical protein